MTDAAYPLPDREAVNNYRHNYSESVWTPDAAVALCHVPWDSSYRDVARFATTAAKNTYFDGLKAAGQSVRLDRLTILKYGEPILLSIPFNESNHYNYIIVESDDYLDNSERYFYFIQDCEYVAPNTTRFWVQLDVWQTYYDRITINRCYVERGHVAIANSNATKNTLSQYLTIPEGLDFGNEYTVTEQVYWNLLQTQPYVIVVSTTDLESDFGSVTAPNLSSATGGIYDNVPSGCNVYAFSGEHFKELMEKLSGYPWISQGIIMLTMVPRKMLTLGTAHDINGVPGYNLAGVDTSDLETFTITDMFSRFNIPARYARLLKFYTFPYSFIEMTTLSGGEVHLKPESFQTFNNSGKTHNIQFALLSSVAPPHIRALIYPKGYNNEGESYADAEYLVSKDVSNTDSPTVIPGGDGIDIAVQLGNFPQFTLVNNQYLAYLATTAHTRAFMFENADWSYTKAQAGNRLGFNQATNSMGVRQSATDLSIGAMQQQLQVQQMSALANGAAGVVGNAAYGNAAGAASAAVGAGVQFVAAGANTGINAALAAGQTANTNAGARYQRDTNLDYANFANQGDYQNAVHQIQAKVQDARLSQPSTSGQNGGEGFNWANNMIGVLFKFKRIKSQFVATVGEYWFRYGYYVNTFLTPPATLACCTKFTYWKMHEIYLSSGNVPELYKNTFRGIFQKGVTVWVNPTEIGVVDPADNLPLGGVNY